MKKVLTVSAAQAKKIGLLVAHTNSKYPILYDPKSGVNLKATVEVGEYLEIPRPDDLATINKFVADELCALVDLEEAMTVTGIPSGSVANGTALPATVTLTDTESSATSPAAIAFTGEYLSTTAGDYVLDYVITLPELWIAYDGTPLSGTTTVTVQAV